MRFWGVVLLLIAAWGFYYAFRPRRAWRASQAWAYENPDAVEPSSAGFAVQAVGSFIGAVAALVAGGFLLLAPTPEQEAEARLACEEALSELAAVADFDEYRLLNSSEVRAAADDLGVEIEIKHRESTSPMFDGTYERYVSSIVLLLDSEGEIGSLSASLGAHCR